MDGWLADIGQGTVQDAIKKTQPILETLEERIGAVVNLAVSQAVTGIKQEREALEDYLNDLTVEIHATITIKPKSKL